MHRSLLIGLSFVICMTVPGDAQARTTCKSFKTYAEALAYYTERRRAGKSGWKSLDRDRDGKPCECLPGNTERDPKACKNRKK